MFSRDGASRLRECELDRPLAGFALDPWVSDRPRLTSDHAARLNWKHVSQGKDRTVWLHHHITYFKSKGLFE